MHRIWNDWNRCCFACSSIRNWFFEIFSRTVSELRVICVGWNQIKVDMAPRLAGLLHGLVDTLYAAAGFVVPLMCNALIKGHEYQLVAWSRVWYTCVGFSLVGMVAYLIFVKCEETDWSKALSQSKSTSNNVQNVQINSENWILYF